MRSATRNRPRFVPAYKQRRLAREPSKFDLQRAAMNAALADIAAKGPVWSALKASTNSELTGVVSSGRAESFLKNPARTIELDWMQAHDSQSGVSGEDPARPRIVSAEIEVVPIVGRALENCTGRQALQDGVLAAVEADLAKIVDWGAGTVDRLKDVRENAGANLPQDVVLSLLLTLLGISELRAKVIALVSERNELLRRLEAGECCIREAFGHV